MTNETKTAPPPRRQWRRSDAERHLAAWKKSGLTLSAFARKLGVNPERLRQWKIKLFGPDSEDALEFVPVVPSLPRPTLAQLEITLRGVTLRTREQIPEDQLARIVAALLTVLPPC